MSASFPVTKAGLHGIIAVAVVLTGVVSVCQSVHATDGYFAHGYGVQSEGMGGAAIAYPKDSLALATNPAAAIDLGDRLDVGIELFRPDRGASITGNAFGVNQSYDGNGLENFPIPQFGYVRHLTDDVSAGIAIYGNGGMNTHYGTNPYGRFGARGDAGVNLEQLFISPTIAYRFAPGNSIGISLNIADQLFKAYGIGALSAFSTNSAAFSDRGTGQALAWGARIGYLGHITPALTAGAFWQSKTYSDQFSRYAGLFADAGAFDVPSTYGVGLSYAATDSLDLAFDVQRIEYSGVNSVGKPLSQLFYGNGFGSNAGPGFGWRDVTVFKLGVNYRINPAWQVRAGWNYTTQAVPSDQTFLNILAPGVVRHNLTAGATWTLPEGIEISGYTLYAPETTIHGHGSIPAAFGGGEASVHLSEFSVGVAVGWRFGGL